MKTRVLALTVLACIALTGCSHDAGTTSHPSVNPSASGGVGGGSAVGSTPHRPEGDTYTANGMKLPYGSVTQMAGWVSVEEGKRTVFTVSERDEQEPSGTVWVTSIPGNIGQADTCSSMLGTSDFTVVKGKQACMNSEGDVVHYRLINGNTVSWTARRNVAQDKHDMFDMVVASLVQAAEGI